LAGFGAIPLTSLDFARIAHLLEPEHLADKVVVQVGLGSGGAPVSDHLTMNGVRRWELFDPDTLEPVNLVKHPRQRKDVGRLKVEIQREWILDRNPSAEVNAYAVDVMSADSFPRSVERSSLVLCCADKKEVRQFVNVIARQYDKRCVTASVFRQGFGGEVYAYLPSETGCFACMDRAADEQGININDAIQLLPEEEEHMYGLNLQDYQASGLSLDIQAIAQLQARVALSLLTSDATQPVVAPRANWLIYYNRPLAGVSASGFNKLVPLRIRPRKGCICAERAIPASAR
jgi:molybdopterin/thiamine biosynthesis adenylyltransferase